MKIAALPLSNAAAGAFQVRAVAGLAGTFFAGLTRQSLFQGWRFRCRRLVESTWLVDEVHRHGPLSQAAVAIASRRLGLPLFR